MNAQHTNVYQDPHSLGWICMVRDLDGRWIRLGMFGTRIAALAKAGAA